MKDFNFVFTWIVALLGICLTGLVYVLFGKHAAIPFGCAYSGFLWGYHFRDWLGGRHG